MSFGPGVDGDTLDLILDSITEFAHRELPESTLIALDERDEFPADVIHKMCSSELGIQLLFIAEEYGGMGGGTFDIYRVCERMARIDVGVATAVLATFLGSDPITVGGTPEQKKAWMTRIAEEGLLMAYGATEPEAGSDLGALKTVAVPVTEDGRPLLDPRQRTRRPIVVRARPGSRGVLLRQAREQARHSAQQHRRPLPRRRRGRR
jgi:alkylation response protein AidB-like acyl-CoA dehydrogenase